MECSNCGGKMVKWKYLQYEELEPYLSGSQKISSSIENYGDWIRTLCENDLVLTLFKRSDFSGVKEKYYLRVVERSTKNGIKLRYLTRVFRYETGEVVYDKKRSYDPVTIYRILPIDERIDAIIRDYCKDKEMFDIDRLNKIITKAIKTPMNPL